MWDSIKEDVKDHIIRYDSRGIEETTQAIPLGEETENPK
jgi:hypothetical protein|nr:MAG TPA: hypothetical protein [Caudoviricetes sp.]